MSGPRFSSARRRFLRRSGGTLLGASSAALLASCAGLALGSTGRGYGRLRRVPDQNGEEVLALPEGFRYVTCSRTGEPLLDGSGGVPRSHDGMAAFDAPHGIVRLIRNHELRNSAGDFSLGVPHAGTPYDSLAVGGTVTLDFDPGSMRPVREFVSLCGTYVNCAGGLAYRDAGWLSCEETVADARQGFARPHGYTFLVPAAAGRAIRPIALRDLGRFVKEAAVADPRTGVVYQTEDDGNASGFYRFVPRDPEDLCHGGRLQMLKVSHAPRFTAFTGQTVGRALAAEWTDIEHPDPDLAAGQPSCFQQGRAQGGAAFNRLEGIHRGAAGAVYFVSTSGGEARRGQLWQYRPRGPDSGWLTLVFQSPGSAVLDSPDNLCVTPRGALLFCEDDASGDGDIHPLAFGLRNVNRLIGLGRDGLAFEFAVNVYNQSEFAGACFSPDGRILFVNLFGLAAPRSGMTCAITGPWEDGPL